MMVLSSLASISEMIPHIHGLVDPPNIIQSAINRKLLKIVRHFGAVNPDRWHCQTNNIVYGSQKYKTVHAKG